MSAIIKQQLEYHGSKKVKIKAENGFIYYGFVLNLDDEYVLIQLDNSKRTVVIKMATIQEVVLFE